jgi:glycosyltransferase involved in cell wall biosynthesis
MDVKDKILILTPVKNAEQFLDNYIKRAYSLTYPHELISLGFLESDSSDRTYSKLAERITELNANFRGAALWKRDFEFQIPLHIPRWTAYLQRKRLEVLAKSRNYLLFRALDDEDWVLWLDADIVDYPRDIIQRLVAAGKDIVQPNCVLEYGGSSFDLNAWRDHGKLHLHDLRLEGDLVRLDTVGGTMLLVRANLHREGLVFPSFPYGKQNRIIRKRRFVGVRQVLGIVPSVMKSADFAKLLKGLMKGDILRILQATSEGEIETEGLAVMAHDMGYECWGMPNLEIKHARA